MAKISAGKVYFIVLAIVSVLISFIVYRGISSPSGLVTGLTLGFVLGETITLVAFSFFLLFFKIDVESKFRINSLLGLSIFSKKQTAQVKEVKVDRVVKITRNIPFLNRVAERIEQQIRADVLKAGVQLDPYAFAAKYSFYSVVLAIIVVPLSLILTVLISPTLLALMLVPAILLYTPSLSVKDKVQSRKTNVKDELPFFALLSAILQSAGRTLLDAFNSTIGKKILPAIEVEARLIMKSIGFGKDVTGALDDLASTHPDDTFKHFLYGYTGVLKSGGDIVLYLSDRAREYLATMRFRWQSYAQKIGTIGEMLIIVFLLLPLLLVVGAIVLPPDLVAEISYIGVAALPMIALVMYFLVRSAQPKVYDILNGDKRLGLIGLIASLIATSFTGQLWLIIAVSGAVGAALYGISIRAQLREIKLTEAALPDFLRNIAEYRKIGYNMRKAILETASKAKFNPVFDAILERIATQINLGVRLGEVKVAIRSWIGRMTLFILDQISESGGGTPANIEDLYNFISGYNNLKKEAISSVRLYKLLGYAIPIAIPLVVKIVSDVIGSFGTSTTGFLGGGTVSLSILNNTVNIITVVAAGAIAFTMTKATEFTAKNTFNMTILFTLAVLAIVFTQYLPSFSIGFG